MEIQFGGRTEAELAGGSEKGRGDVGDFERVKEGLVVRSGGSGVEREWLGGELGCGESGRHFFLGGGKERKWEGKERGERLKGREGGWGGGNEGKGLEIIASPGRK